MCIGPNGTGTGFFPSNYDFPSQHHSTSGMHIRLHLLLLSEGQAGNTWKLLNKHCCRNIGSIRVEEWI